MTKKFVAIGTPSLFIGWSLYLVLSGRDISIASYWQAFGAFILSLIVTIVDLKPENSETGKRNIPKMRRYWGQLYDLGLVEHDFIEPTTFYPDLNDLPGQLKRKR